MKKFMFLLLVLGIVSGIATYTSNVICGCGDDECTSQYSGSGDDEQEASVDETCPPIDE